MKHIFQGYGPIFQFRAAGAVMKWSSFGWKNQTRTLVSINSETQKTVVIIVSVSCKYMEILILLLRMLQQLPSLDFQ